MPYASKEDRNAYSREWRRDHPEISRRWRSRNPEQNLKSHRDFDAKHRYGLTYEESVNIRKKPCEICGTKAKKMCIDHEGPPNKFNQSYRGVLCQQCNTRLGWYEKRQESILNYITKEVQEYAFC